MDNSYRVFNSGLLSLAWSFLNEYHDFRRLAHHRKKIQEQLRVAHIPLTNVPWKMMVQATLSANLFTDEQLKSMSSSDMKDCYKIDDINESEATINLILENNGNNSIDIDENLTDKWFELNELKLIFQQATHSIPKNRYERRKILYKILGYPIGYSDNEADEILQSNDDEEFDLNLVLTKDEQSQMRTGDLIEFSGNRLHDAFYIYLLPRKGIWKQIQQMWTNHRIEKFHFDGNENEIILIPAMDEYGYGVPYVFATRSNHLLPSYALYKYVDINCPLININKDDSIIFAVQKHLNERLKNPIYRDQSMNVEMSIEPNQFPQEYVALIYINDTPKGNIVWTQRVHYDNRQVAKDLNDNRDIFYSRRILEAEEQYRYL